MKVQSFSDIITNSSSEVFLYTTGNADLYLKEFIDNVLKVVKSDLTCDELFRIKNFDTCLSIEALQEDNKEEAEEMDNLINNLFYASD